MRMTVTGHPEWVVVAVDELTEDERRIVLISLWVHRVQVSAAYLDVPLLDTFGRRHLTERVARVDEVARKFGGNPDEQFYGLDRL